MATGGELQEFLRERFGFPSDQLKVAGWQI
jgi:hypothetical protein